MALEASSGILSEHQGSPTAVFGTRQGSWNATMDPYLDDEHESPLWTFARSRALNRLALRTKLAIAVDAAAPAASTSTRAPPGLDPVAGYIRIPEANCYNEGHGGTVLPGVGKNMTAASCAALCTASKACDCATYQARPGEPEQHIHQYSCWLRANCQPAKFERDTMTRCYDVYVKKSTPQPPHPAGGALAYLKHDALGRSHPLPTMRQFYKDKCPY